MTDFSAIFSALPNHQITSVLISTKQTSPSLSPIAAKGISSQPREPRQSGGTLTLRKHSPSTASCGLMTQK